MIRRIVEDYEAKLISTDGRAGATAHGKAEWERYGSDDEELSVRVRNVDLPDGTELDAHLNGGYVGRLKLKDGYAIIKLQTKKGDGRQTPSNSDERAPRSRGQHDYRLPQRHRVIEG